MKKGIACLLLSTLSFQVSGCKVTGGVLGWLRRILAGPPTQDGERRRDPAPDPRPRKSEGPPAPDDPEGPRPPGDLSRDRTGGNTRPEPEEFRRLCQELRLQAERANAVIEIVGAFERYTRHVQSLAPAGAGPSCDRDGNLGESMSRARLRVGADMETLRRQLNIWYRDCDGVDTETELRARRQAAASYEANIANAFTTLIGREEVETSGCASDGPTLQPERRSTPGAILRSERRWPSSTTGDSSTGSPGAGREVTFRASSAGPWSSTSTTRGGAFRPSVWTT
jgi:hypothetical protein